MNNLPVIFENHVIKENASQIINYIQNHIDDFGKLGQGYWDGRQIYLEQIKDQNILEVIKHGNRYMLSEFSKLMNITKPIYIDSLHIVRWTEGYELHPHADAVEPDGKPHPFPWRDFGTVTFLNENFDGGILYYPNKNNLKIYPQIGISAIHTGGVDCLHGVTKITKGVRYTIASFLTYDYNHAYNIF